MIAMPENSRHFDNLPVATTSLSNAENRHRLSRHYLFVAGIGIVKLSMPAWLVVIHSLNALVLVLPLIAIRFYSRYTRLDAQEVPAQPEVQSEEQAELIAELEPVEPESLYLRLKSQLGKTRTGLGAALSVVT
jgi:fused signal recognition particle receptor